ncbi:MAG: hypothetical protein NTV34_04955 [Proteobacteria bacterium]|nr:hypothetical protein [Pseudomonadota bacterium]
MILQLSKVSLLVATSLMLFNASCSNNSKFSSPSPVTRKAQEPARPAQPTGNQNDDIVIDPKTGTVPNPTTGPVLETSTGGNTTTTVPPVIPPLETNGGGGVSTPKLPYNLVVNIGPAVSKVVITKSGEAAAECTASCTKTFLSGSVILVSVIPNAAAAPVTRTFNRWDGGCALNGAANSECSLTIASNVTIQPVFTDVGNYVVGMNARMAHILRNSLYLLKWGGFATLTGMPPGNCSVQATCDAIFIFNDAASRAQTCSQALPGSAVEQFTSGNPDLSGWQKYFNLYIAQFNGSSWTNKCSGGNDCYVKSASVPYVATLSCKKESR